MLEREPGGYERGLAGCEAMRGDAGDARAEVPPLDHPPSFGAIRQVPGRGAGSGRRGPAGSRAGHLIASRGGVCERQAGREECRGRQAEAAQLGTAGLSSPCCKERTPREKVEVCRGAEPRRRPATPCGPLPGTGGEAVYARAQAAAEAAFPPR